MKWRRRCSRACDIFRPAIRASTPPPMSDSACQRGSHQGDCAAHSGQNGKLEPPWGATAPLAMFAHDALLFLKRAAMGRHAVKGCSYAVKRRSTRHPALQQKEMTGDLDDPTRLLTPDQAEQDQPRQQGLYQARNGRFERRRNDRPHHDGGLGRAGLYSDGGRCRAEGRPHDLAGRRPQRNQRAQQRYGDERKEGQNERQCAA